MKIYLKFESFPTIKFENVVHEIAFILSRPEYINLCDFSITTLQGCFICPDNPNAITQNYVSKINM